MNKKVIRLTESDLHRIVKESVNIILEKDELGLLDRIERALPWTDAHKLHKRAEDIRARRKAEMAEYDKQKRREAEQERIQRQEAERRRQSYARSQSTQAQPQRNDIYSQTINALNRNNHSFFRGRKELQGVLASLYDGNKITYREYDQGLQWIGMGYR